MLKEVNNFTLLESSIYALTIINPTNLMGVMGAGIALSLAHRFPTMKDQYRALVKANELKQGCVVLYAAREIEIKVVSLPTKYHWKNDSDLNLIKAGLETLVHQAQMLGPIAMPRIGAGLGRLNWEEDVLPLVEDFAGHYPYDISVCHGKKMSVVHPHPHHENGMSWILEYKK